MNFAKLLLFNAVKTSGIQMDLPDTSSITKHCCFKYSEDGIVCPLALDCGLFTDAAIGNIDGNSSSSDSRRFMGQLFQLFNI